MSWLQTNVALYLRNGHPGSPYMRGTRCGIAHSAAKLRNVPRAHLATGEVHEVPIYPLFYGADDPPGLTTPCFMGLTTPVFFIRSLLHIITSLLHHYYIIITMSIMGKMMHNMV